MTLVWTVLALFSAGTALLVYFGCFYSQSFEDRERQEVAFEKTAVYRYLGFALVMVSFVLSWFV
jgi:hypothetical protein